MDQLEKQFYKIKEIALMLGVAQSTLRFWEKEFPSLKPTRSPHNIRYYKAADVEKLRIIKYLVKDKGLKIEAAREYLRTNPHNTSKRLEIVSRLKEIRTELDNIVRALDNRAPKALR